MNETSHCILCGNDNTPSLTIERYGYTFSTVKCRQCGFVSIEPRPGKESVEQLYKMDYFHGEGFDKSINYMESLNKIEINKPLFQSRLETIERFSPKGTILDAGCGVGDFLLTARERGWNVEGVEISEDAANVCRQNGITVYTTTLETLAMRDTYDCIIMVEVIEHLMDPTAVLENCHRALKSNGILVIQTGNIESIYARLARERWFYFLYGHLNYFSPRTLGSLLERQQFKTEKIFFGDEITLAAYIESFRKGKKKSSLRNWGEFLSMLLFQLSRRLHVGNLSAGAMVFYARKQ